MAGPVFVAVLAAAVVLVSLAFARLVFAGGRPRAGSGLGMAAATGVVIAG